MAERDFRVDRPYVDEVIGLRVFGTPNDHYYNAKVIRVAPQGKQFTVEYKRGDKVLTQVLYISKWCGRAEQGGYRDGAQAVSLADVETATLLQLNRRACAKLGGILQQHQLDLNAATLALLQGRDPDPVQLNKARVAAGRMQTILRQLSAGARAADVRPLEEGE